MLGRAAHERAFLLKERSFSAPQVICACHAAYHYTQSYARHGVTRHVIITDEDDFVNWE